MRKRTGYSIHVIHANGAPVPVRWKRLKKQATAIAEETAAATGCEVRVWDTRTARCVETIPASTRREVA